MKWLLKNFAWGYRGNCTHRSEKHRLINGMKIGRVIKGTFKYINKCPCLEREREWRSTGHFVAHLWSNHHSVNNKHHHQSFFLWEENTERMWLSIYMACFRDRKWRVFLFSLELAYTLIRIELKSMIQQKGKMQSVWGVHFDTTKRKITRWWLWGERERGGDSDISRRSGLVNRNQANTKKINCRTNVRSLSIRKLNSHD